MKKKGEIGFGPIIGVIVALIMLSLIWGLQRSATNYETLRDTAALGTQSVPFNITLSGNDPQALVSVANNTVANATTTTDSSNYTDYVSAGYLQIDDNTTLLAATLHITYTNQHVGYISGATTRLIVGFIAVMLAIGIIVWLVKKDD